MPIASRDSLMSGATSFTHPVSVMRSVIARSETPASASSSSAFSGSYE